MENFLFIYLYLPTCCKEGVSLPNDLLISEALPRLLVGGAQHEVDKTILSWDSVLRQSTQARSRSAGCGGCTVLWETSTLRVPEWWDYGRAL